MRAWLSAAVVVFLVAVPRVASADPPTETEVRRMLSTFEHTAGADEWRAMGNETVGVLVALYDDGSERPWVRLRAVRAASHFPIEATRTFLLAVARTPRQSDLFVREALIGLARAFGDRAVADVAPYLEDARPVVREGAAIGLGQIASATAREALRRRLAVEGTESVRLTIQRSLARESR